MSAVAAHVLDAAIAWQLCLDSGTATASERQAGIVSWCCSTYLAAITAPTREATRPKR